MKQFILSVFFLLGIASFEAKAAMYKFDYLQCKFNVNLPVCTISLGVVDNRSYVLSGKHKPEYVGILRGGYGNPWNVDTKSGNPFVDDVASCLEKSFKQAGFNIENAGVRFGDDNNKAIQKLNNSSSDKKLLFVINDWYTDNISSFSKQWTDVYYDITLTVYDNKGNQLSTVNLQKKEAVTAKTNTVFRAHMKDKKMAGPNALIIVMDDLLQQEQIKSAFNGSIKPKNNSSRVVQNTELQNTKGAEDDKADNNSRTPVIGVADELAKYKKLLDSGAITQEEYNEQKKKLLNGN